MKTLRSFRSIVFLAVAALGLLAGSSAAQTVAHGKFSLEHEVHWQNALVPPGEYEFFVNRTGGAQFLMLQRTGVGSAGFFLMIPTSAPADTSGIDKLLIVHRGEQRFVSSMELPQYGVSLDFSVPSETADSGKPVAQLRTVTSGGSE
ncbi:MAG: hypothetical protein WB952_19530 [Terriglobales bacterium]